MSLLLIPAAAQASALLQRQFQSLLHNADLRQTTYSIMVRDLASGETLVDLNGHAAMIPASNMKLVSSLAALDLLGPEFIFETTLSYLPAADAGTLPDLRVTASGDPAFGDPKLLAEHGVNVEQLLEQYVAAVRATGRQHFGRLLIDDRVFDQDFVHDTWPRDQLNRWYCAQVAGLNFHNNCLDITPSPAGRAGLPAGIAMSPRADFIPATNRTVTADDSTFWISRRLGTNEITYRGNVRYRLAEPVSVTVHDPPMFFGRLLRERLARAGIRVDQVVRIDPPAGPTPAKPGQPIYIFRSTMPVILERVNSDSQNLFAEALLKRMGHELTGQPGTWTTGAAAIRQAVHQRLGAGAANLMIADGSGMSRANRVSAALLTDLLASVYDQAHQPDASPDAVARWQLFRDSLAYAGEADSTLRHRLDDLDATVRAKTGYIRGVSALSGYVFVPVRDAATGRSTIRAVAFSFLFNDIAYPVTVRKIKQVQDQLVELIADHVEASVAAW